jgi:threonine synthase
MIGMWKAFDELEQLGWIGSQRPKMIAVQAAGCAPIVQAFEQGKEASEFWQGATTAASGLRVPKALGDFLVLRAVRDSGGTAIAVTDQELLDAGQLLAETEGLFIAPEGSACIAALEKLIANGFLNSGEEIVIYNTGTGLKYLENWSTRFRPGLRPEERLGGLIQPR